MTRTAVPRLRIGLLASGGASAAEGLLRATTAGELDADVALLLTDRRGAFALERAAGFGVPAQFLPATGLSREAYHETVTCCLHEAGADLVLMAGYMRIVSPRFVDTWRGRLLNVHPSLLPAFAGLMDLRVHEAVLASGVAETGCTVHHVTEEVDAGRIVLQKRCAVLSGDTPASLKARVQALEQAAFVDVVRHWVQHAPLPAPILED